MRLNYCYRTSISQSKTIKFFSYTKASINRKMQFFTQIFENKIDKYLSPEGSINPRLSPDSLIKTLKSPSQLKYLKKKLSSKTSNIYKMFKRLTVCSLLIVYSNKFYDLVAELPLISTGNKWIDEEFIAPYYMFLKKIAMSNELYQSTKRQCPMPVGKNMELLFYNLGLFKLLFKMVSKMPLLGRYYKPRNQQVVSTFINTIALHAQKIYVSFRQVLGHMIQNPKVHLPTRDDEKMMKAILRDQLAQLNEQMKKLFLDKYFYPLGKGIGIKLFRTQEQPVQSQKVIESIMNDHEYTNRQREKSELEITLFPGPGKVNMKFYEQTLLSNMRIDFGDETKNFEEEVADIGIDENEEVDLDSVNVSIQERFKPAKLSSNRVGKNQLNENQIQTGIQRYEEGLGEI